MICFVKKCVAISVGIVSTAHGFDWLVGKWAVTPNFLGARKGQSGSDLIVAVQNELQLTKLS